MNKNIFAGVIVLAALASAALVMLRMQNLPSSSPSVMSGTDTGAIGKNLSELTTLDSDVSSFSQDNIISSEVDSAINEVGETADAVSLGDEEQNLNNLSNDLNNTSGDEATLNELDKALGEAAL